MKKIEIKIILIGLILLSSCGKSNKDDSGSYVSNVNSEDISHLNTTIDSEDAISNYLPSIIKTEKQLSQYITNSEDSFDELSLKMFTIIDVAAEFKKEKEDIHTTDNSDPSSVGKGALKVGKMFVKGVWSGGKVLMSSGFLFSYKKEYLDFKKTYNETKMDSLKHVMHYMAIKNLFDDQYNAKQTELISSRKSVWNSNHLPDNIKNKVNFEESLALYKKLKLESNRVIKVLLYNKMKGVDCSQQINNQTQDLISFWNSEQMLYENDFKLLNTYFELLSDLKLDIVQKKIAIESSKADFNEQIISDLNNFIAVYNKEVIQNINDIIIYDRIPVAEKEIKKKIKEGSDIYFE
jgi:hypothetical protein